VIQSYCADADPEPEETRPAAAGWLGGMRERMRGIVGRNSDQPGLAGVMVDAFNITQDRISRSRLAGDPPDVMIGPKLARVGLFDFHRAEETMALGRAAAERALDEIGAMLEANQVPLN
jgi:NTE family protein